MCPKANPCRCKGVCSINQRKIGDPKPEKADFYINQIEEYRLYNLNLATDLNQLRENHLNDSQMVKFKDDEARFQPFWFAYEIFSGIFENHIELSCVKLVNEELTSKLLAMEQKLNEILASQITTKDRILCQN